MSDLIKAISQLTAALNAPVLPVKNEKGEIIGARREVPPAPTPSEMDQYWDRLERLAREGKINMSIVFSLMRGLAKGVEQRKQQIALLEANVIAMQAELRAMRNG